MKSLLAVAAYLITVNAQAMSIETIYNEGDPRTRGATPIKINAASCDSDRNPTACSLYVIGNSGRVKRFEIDKDNASYTYTSASQRELTVRDVPPDDLQTLLNLGVAIEKLGQDCTSVIVLKTGTAEIQQLTPGCDI